ncbi:MAG: DUF2804 domain-containing protein [Deltaproteobacteria bacterium]|nr:DUF2804 domain-containing protein [Deltaproteobacteria bacterium]
MSAVTRLVDAAGDVRLGIFDAPVLEVNYRDYALTDPFGRPAGRLARRFGFNQFQFLGALSEELVFGCAITDLKYVGTAFAYCYEPATRRFAEWSFTQPLARATRFTQTPETGTCVFAARKARITMTGDANPSRRRLVATVGAARAGDAATAGGALAIDAVFHEDAPPIEPMRICTRAGATGWVYARKTAGQRLTGALTWEGRTFDLGAMPIHGHHDWSAGYMRRHTFWNWGCLAGALADGRVVGMNVSCGVNETSFTENCFWLDGRLHKLDTVAFAYDRRDLMRPWRVSSYDGRLALEFHPEGRHAERINARIVASNFNQLFGRYRGSLTTGGGERVTIDDMLGYMESHYAKW